MWNGDEHLETFNVASDNCFLIFPVEMVGTVIYLSVLLTIKCRKRYTYVKNR